MCVEVLSEIVTVILFIPLISLVRPKMVWLCSGDKKKGELLSDVSHCCLEKVRVLSGVRVALSRQKLSSWLNKRKIPAIVRHK